MLEQLTVRRKIIGLDYLMVEQIVRMLDICRERGQVRADLETAEAAMTIYSFVIAASITHIVEEDMTLKNFLGLVKHQICLLFQGIAPRPATQEKI